MPRRRFSVSDLWATARVGDPVTIGATNDVVVPVTDFSMDDNKGTTRLWRVHVPDRGRARTPKPLTSADASATSPVVSPDGRRLAFIRSVGTDTDKVEQAHVLDLDGGEARVVTDAPVGVKSLEWFPDSTRLAVVSTVYRTARSPEAARRERRRLRDDPVRAHVTEDRIYRAWDRWVTDDEVHHVLVVDVAEETSVDLTPTFTQWIELMGFGGRCLAVSPDGKEVAFHANLTRSPHHLMRRGIYTVRLPRGSAKPRPPKLITDKVAANASQPMYDPSGERLFYLMNRDTDFYADRQRLAVYERSRRRHRVLTEAFDRSIQTAHIDPAGRSIVLTAEHHARTALFSVSLERARSAETVTPKEIYRGGTFGGPALVGRDIVVAESSLSSAPELVRVAAGRSRRISSFTKSVMADPPMGRVEEIIFDGAGGDPVQMFVVHPPDAKFRSGRPTRRRPLVHLVHGGPHSVFGDAWHWRWSAQAFAAQGYAVALVNFHGSTSWGQAYAASIHGAWGEMPYEDVMRATDVLVDEGIAHPERMAVAGGSYGGYLVSWIVSQTDRFRAAVNHAGVCDLQTQFASDFTFGRRRGIGGEPWDRVEAMDRYNPMRHCRGMKTPMLVLHGELDYRVPYVQGLQIYNVYKARRRPARLVCYPDENHWILKPQNSVHWYGEVFDWLERWIG